MTFNKGDRVYVYGSSLDAIRKEVITRVTKTQAIIENDHYTQRFNRENGRLIAGGTWNVTSIHLPSPYLDRLYRAKQIRSAAIHLSEAARSGDSEKTREAYTAWDRLVREEQSNDQ